MPEVHAKLSPSAAERWTICPGSIRMSDGMPSKSSKFADEGTLAHSVAEAMLNGGVFEASDEMIRLVRVYVDHVDALADHPYAECHIEAQVKVTDNLWGTADAIVWRPDTATLHVVDLKYGAGVGVEVRGNLQLQIYALAALLTFGYPAATVNVGIVQPRFNHPDGPCRSVDFSAVDLLDFHAGLMDAIARVDDASHGRKNTAAWQEEYLHPTEKACRWCLGAPICPKLASKSQELAKVAFAPAMTYDPALLASTLDQLALMEGWIKNVREFAYAEAEAGRPIPNYKLVEKRAVRKWMGDESAIVEALHNAGVTDLYEVPKMITPAAAEKLLGKADKNLLDDLCVKESSGHTLVHASDKRPAVRIDAQSAFA